MNHQQRRHLIKSEEIDLHLLLRNQNEVAIVIIVIIMGRRCRISSFLVLNRGCYVLMVVVLEQSQLVENSIALLKFQTKSKKEGVEAVRRRKGKNLLCRQKRGLLQRQIIIVNKIVPIGNKANKQQR